MDLRHVFSTENCNGKRTLIYITEKLVLINSLWEELKSDIDVGLPIYIICGGILAVLIGGGGYLAIRKRKRDRY